LFFYSSFYIIFSLICLCLLLLFFSYIHPSPSEIYTLSLHDALPIWDRIAIWEVGLQVDQDVDMESRPADRLGRSPSICWTRLHIDRKSTRLNSSQVEISYAVFCLNKKKKKKKNKTKKKNINKEHKTI